MLFSQWKPAGRLVTLVAALCLSQGLSQAALGQTPTPVVIAEPLPVGTDDRIEPNEPGSGFDVLARSFSRKKRSELINLKTYTDAEWARLERAVDANRNACRKGDAQACLAAGDAYASGDGVWTVSAIAFILYKEACEAGLGAGCVAFFDLSRSGYGDPEGGYEAASRLLEQACDLGDLIGCDKFAKTLRENGPDASAIARSDAILERACAAGGNEACLSLSALLMKSGRPEDYDRAADMLDTMCRQSVLEACQTMAIRSRKKPEPDEFLASQYEHFACYLGGPAECLDVGERAYWGTAVAQDRDLALTYYDKACQLDPGYCDVAETLRAMPRLRSACTPDDPQACAALGQAIANALSPEYDREAALQLLETSCRAGAGNACYAAVRIISRGKPARSQRIDELLELGCEADDPDACFNLARALEQGNAETANIERAVALYSRLCDAEFPGACAAESQYAGIVASARMAPADERFPAPLAPEGASDVLQASVILEVCFSGSERFRGKTYTEFHCERGEKGIGSMAARPGQAPWQALFWRPAILKGNRLSAAQRVQCGGSVIAQGWVLTAAHCLTDKGVAIRDGGHRVRLGVYYSRLDEGVSYPILRTIPHPQYDPSNKYVFDIALVQYDHRAGRTGTARAGANAIRSISLDPLDVGQRTITKGMPVYSFGWGWTEAENSNSTDYLQIVKMELISENACTAVTKFRNALGNAALCAGGKKREQTCFGDSGGPLVHYDDGGARPVLIGVVSAGKKCGATGRPSQYTRIAAVKDWIASYVPAIR
jgi:TPR repeat protein